MKEIIEQYGRVFLITVVMILILLFIPGLAKLVDNLGNSSIKNQKETVSDEFTFYIDGKKYKSRTGMTWDEWAGSAYNTDGYKIVDICGYKYFVIPESQDAYGN